MPSEVELSVPGCPGVGSIEIATWKHNIVSQNMKFSTISAIEQSSLEHFSNPRQIDI